ncbi:c-type cytochrome [Limisphaera ngatamarikiensis]|uniref:C-type cytochrome n=1 Tax=Limisphaera ngatamarikiensis TaxID=1324935 RepID=A0A6M1RV61_9BACT|nr:c-type cytochrome [Limisphaera ngatamarikiensis]
MKTSGARLVSGWIATLLGLGAAWVTGAGGTLEDVKGDLELGRRLYDQHCAPCHGVDGSGQGAGGHLVVSQAAQFQRRFVQDSEYATRHAAFG